MDNKCSVTGMNVQESEGIYCKDLRPSVKSYLHKKNEGLNDESFISFEAMNILLREYITDVTHIEQETRDNLLRRIREQFETSDLLKPIDPPDENDKQLTFGEKMADHIADFGGSWKFILMFLGFISVWMLFNMFVLHNKGFDPYPFILLNLILSCLAALQAPVIMMSQNRQEDKDRERAQYDVKVDMKAEKEIRILHKKIDHLLVHQQEKMTEVLQAQMDLIQHMQQKLDNIKK
jgi:Predicted membrane protein